ncbi:hypothetical protein NSA33_01830 [Mammaliicoccus lentus]|uniref:hypothetical protein n=1 Tax=Mammaliicoccus lentus TaxID=42858 RepID=UPI00214B76AB|nr:hypothetical protein [Mammaliicoccus lentus]MCR1871889.1 hypothetical protein [Mammaliicoccus lentus]
MYILSLQDDETTQLIGAFNTEEDVVSWINSVPNVKKEHNDNYILKIEDLPEFINIKWKDSIVPLTRYSFSTGEYLYFSWKEIAYMNQRHGITSGSTKIDNYYYDNNEVKEEVKLRQSLKQALKDYFEKNNQSYYFGGKGSQDGEYINTEDGTFLHIDPSTLEEWKSTQDIEKILNIK